MSLTNEEITAILATSIVIGVLLIFAICCCAYCRRNKNKKESPPESINTYSQFTSTLPLHFGKQFCEKVQPDVISLSERCLPELGENPTPKSDEVDSKVVTPKITTKEKRPNLGKLQYSLEYDFTKLELKVKVIQARDLPKMDFSGLSDPYVKLYLDGERKKPKKYETKIHKKTLNPVFNEEFRLKIPFAEIGSRNLIFSVYDYDRFSKHDLIGEVIISLCKIDYGTIFEAWDDIRPRATGEKNTQLGSLCFSLCYIPTAGKLTVVILEARSLRKMDLIGLSDPYVKLYLIQNGKRGKKKKTTKKMNTINPYYNESFVFEVPYELLPKTSLLLKVIDYDRIGVSDPIGEIRIGANQGEKASQHWNEMISNPRRPIAQWHELKDITK